MKKFLNTSLIIILILISFLVGLNIDRGLETAAAEKKERVEVFYKKLEESKKLNRNIKLLQEALKLQKLFTESSIQAEKRRLDFYKLIYKAHNEQSDYFLIS